MDQSAVDAVNLILRACKNARLNRQSAAYVLATAFHETGGLKRKQPPLENLNYSADRLRAVWPSRFAGQGMAEAVERNPAAIANRVYADRMGNGNEASGDGWRYRGRGFVQLTGRDNYRRMGRLLGAPIEEQPELAGDPEIAAKILVVGMQRGLFTGVSLDDVSEPATSTPDFTDDRAIVNGHDRASKIATHADVFYEALADVDLLSDSRTVKAAKAAQTTSSVGVLTGLGTAGGLVAQAVTSDPEGLIRAAKTGSILQDYMPYLAPVAIAVMVAFFVYTRVQAALAEKARREDNEVLGV